MTDTNRDAPPDICPFCGEDRRDGIPKEPCLACCLRTFEAGHPACMKCANYEDCKEKEVVSLDNSDLVAID